VTIRDIGLFNFGFLAATPTVMFQIASKLCTY